ncbi:MAG: prenyltransferase/squalene oxidase repeat-containing protein [Planctomycetaceae bacterium]
MAEAYLLDLSGRLSDGLARLPPERRKRHAQFIRAQQQADGGFAGREGGADLYYTSFAVRALAMLDELSHQDCVRIGGYLKPFASRSLSVIDLVNWLYSAFAIQATGAVDVLQDEAVVWAERMVARLYAVRTDDGGFAKSVEGARGSTYHSFLVVLALQLLGQTVRQPNSLVQFVFDRQRDDGGFVEIAPMKRSGTNPTAAAVALLRMLGGLDDEIRRDVREFLIEVRSDEGGFQANSRIPFADGLSTFTGLLTVQDLNLEGVLDPGRVERFQTEWLEFPTGGFRGASWDEQADVEYTFYGLGTLALLWSAQSMA